MRTKAPNLIPLFRSDLQVHLLALVLLNPDRTWTSGELCERLNASPPSVHRELHRALASGIVERDITSAPYRYVAAASSPLVEPLQRLLDRTVGVERRLRALLSEREGVEAALIHGSWAQEELRPTSDIDLLVVGDVDYEALAAAVRGLEPETGRTIDLLVFGVDELRERRRRGEGFLGTVLARPVINLVGSVESLVADR